MPGWFDKIRRAVEPDEDSYDFDEEEIYPANDSDDGMIRTNSNQNMYGGNAGQQQMPQNNFGGYGSQPPPNNPGGQQGGYPINNQNNNNNQQGNMIPVNNMNNIAAVSGIRSSAEVIMITPSEKDWINTVGQIARHLMNNKIVVLNLENTNKESSRRCLDFLKGVAFAIEGTVKSINNDTYILSPNSVSVASEQGRDDRNDKIDRAF